MAFANIINRDMTAADARAVAGQESWKDLLPDHLKSEEQQEEYLAEQDHGEEFATNRAVGEVRLFIDNKGNTHIVPNGNPFSGSLAQIIALGEKDGLIELKAKGGIGGSIRDTRSRYGEPKEWDHVVLGLSRAEAEALGEDGQREWFQAAVKGLEWSPDFSGRRQMLVSPIHRDTDNVHIQVLLHRIPFDATPQESTPLGTAWPSFELSRNSEAASQMKAINAVLESHGLPMIADFRMGAFSVSEPRAVSGEELARAAERVKDAGGITPPDLTTGPLPIQRERVTPEMRHLDSMLADAVKRQKEAEAFATSAATAVAAAQHAKAALEQYLTEVKAREAVEAELATASAAYEETSVELAKTTRELESARGEIETLTEQVTTATAKIAEQVDQIETLESEKTELKTDLEDTRQQLGQVDAALDQERAGRAADAKKAADTEAELKAQIAKVTKWLDDEQHARKAEAEAAAKVLEQAQKATQEAKGELQAERDTFLDRARTWADEHVKSPLVAQIDALKEDLAETRRTFAAEMADAQRQFMAQIRELTASIRPRQAEQAAPARQRQQWPSWTQKSFGELTSAEKTAAQKALDSEIKAGRQQEGLRLSDFHRIVNDQWNKQQAAASEQDAGMKPKKP